MKTIEERAKEYAPDPFLSALERKAYIAGATEQKAIDEAELHERFQKVLNGQKWDLIDKACEWLDNYLMEIGYPDDWMRDSPNIKSGKERFRKAMEE